MWRFYSKLLVVWMTAGFLCGAGTALAQSPPPNIIFILTDDLATYETTPQSMPLMMQHIANKGVEFTNFFSVQHLCCPSRTSFLTGRSPHNQNMPSNLTEYNADVDRVYFGGAPWFRYQGLDQDTIATRLQAGGYYTAFSGSKYLNDWPNKLVSYTNNSVTLVNNSTYVPPGWSYWYGPYKGSPNGYNVWFSTKIEGGPVVLDPSRSNQNSYSTDLIFNKAKVMADRATALNKPLFLFLSTSAPHSPFPPPVEDAGCLTTTVSVPITPSYNETNMADKAPPMRKAPLTAGQKLNFNKDYTRRLCSLKAIDRGVANLVNHLAMVPGRLENTYIVFTSDNGFALGQHRYYGKSVPYEEAARLPFYVSGPGIPGSDATQPVPPVEQRRATALTTFLDLTTTFYDLAGVPLASLMEGRSAKQGFLNPTAYNTGGNTREMFFMQGNTSAKPISAGGTGECWIPPVPAAGASSGYVSEYERARRNFRGLRTKQYTYVRWCNSDGSDHRELYDNVADPYQLASLLPQPPYEGYQWRVGVELPAMPVNPAFLAELDARMESLRTCTGQACLAIEDQPIVNPLY